jgi:hypothetical protein
MNDHTVTSPLTDFLIAHGGLDSWRNAKGLSSTIISGGQLWGIKGIDMPPIPRRVTTEFHRQWMQVQPFGNPDWTMTWTPDHARITDEEGTIIAERENGLEAFDRSYDGAWDPLNLAYFNGYAMWTYHAVPFVLANPGYRAREIASITSEGKMLRRVAVRFPPEIHSHSAEQHFYFGDDGLLARHDYEVDVWANTRAAHFVSDYIDVEGLKYPDTPQRLRTKSRRHAEPWPQPGDRGSVGLCPDLGRLHGQRPRRGDPPHHTASDLVTRARLTTDASGRG